MGKLRARCNAVGFFLIMALRARYLRFFQHPHSTSVDQMVLPTLPCFRLPAQGQESMKEKKQSTSFPLKRHGKKKVPMLGNVYYCNWKWLLHGQESSLHYGVHSRNIGHGRPPSRVKALVAQDSVVGRRRRLE